MKDALSTLFWKVLSQVQYKLNMFFSASVPSLSPLFSSSPSPSLSHTILTSIPLFLSPLSGGAGRECDSLGGRYGPDLLPPAELRWINRGYPESPPADALLQRHARCVSACTFASVDKLNPSMSLHLPSVPFEASLLSTLAMTHQHLHFTFVLLQMSSLCLWSDFTLKSQITPELI